MARALRQLRISRLIAAALSLALSVALVVASIAGAVAHANSHHNDHHGEGPTTSISASADQHAHDALVGSSQIISDAAAAEAPDSVPQHTCMDFVCHGGIAVLSASISWRIAPWSMARALPWDSQALVSASPIRLDRPPKSLRSA